MSLNINILNIPLDGTGTEIPTLSVSDPYAAYLLTGTTVAIGNYAIVPTGTPQAGTIFDFIYDGTVDITTNGTTFALFGASFTQAQLLKKWTATCLYNGSAWEVRLNMNFLDTNIVATSHILDSNVTTAKINNLAVTTGKLADDAVTTVKILDSNVTTAKVADDAITNAKLAEMATNTVKANVTGGTANPTDVAISTLVGSVGWKLGGNSGTTPGTDFIGVTDNVDLVFKINNIEAGRLTNATSSNTSFGFEAALSRTSGSNNTAIGLGALRLATTANQNIAIGDASLNANNGDNNIGIGSSALIGVTSGTGNIGIGVTSANTLTTGTNNIVIGDGANVSTSSTTNAIVLGASTTGASNTFTLPNTVTAVKWRGLTYVLPSVQAAGVLTNDGSGNLTWA